MELRGRLRKLEEGLEWGPCEVCAGVKRRDSDDCMDCQRKYGPVLVKCSGDVWPVIVKLKSGPMFVAASCDLRGEWITFVNKDEFHPLNHIPNGHFAWVDLALRGRGLCVALSEIAYAVDTDS